MAHHPCELHVCEERSDYDQPQDGSSIEGGVKQLKWLPQSRFEMIQDDSTSILTRQQDLKSVNSRCLLSILLLLAGLHQHGSER